MKINSRLKMIGDLAPANSFCLDVGCDHAFLDIYLVKRNVGITAIASDIAESTAQVLGETEKVEKIKYLKTEIDKIYKESPTKPRAEESSEEELKTYLAQFDKLKEDDNYKSYFEYTRKFLKDFGATNSEFVDCIYLQYIDFNEQCVVYICDTDERTATQCHPGQIDPIHNENVLKNPKGGFTPTITKTDRYGRLIVAGAPIMDGDDIVAYAMVDIQMNLVRGHQANSIIRLTIYLAATLLALGVAGVAWASFWMIRPLRKLIKLTNSYNSFNPKENHEQFEKFDINTGDEIQDLADSLKMMENDVYVRFNELIETNRLLITSKEETKKMEMLANQDGLTGVKNKVSYNAEVNRINEMIKNGEYTNFAVVMIDLNYLKDTNDTYGHDTGDIALIKLAELICDTFKFSPVYRVGGDEFVVISRSKDYLRVDKLVEELKKKTNKSIDVHDGENISAAVGFSTYNPQIDKSVDDVFKRADKAMYEHKRQLKNM